MPADAPNTPEHPRIAALARVLARRPAETRPGDGGIARAAVAILLRDAQGGLELLLIRRAERAGDPWSGHMALPGGREQADDAGPEHTAARETREEVGIDVAAGGRLVGALEPVGPHSARAPRILVRPFVFAVPADVQVQANHEVSAAVWIPVDELLAPGAVTEHLLEMGDAEPLRFPALDARGHVVWGLTHRILGDFLHAYQQAA
ncbi:MAG TPA: CoA pyrophosphatase [Longimicrobium sp.]|jgi:8-oxo-dGTP pyrophosphatase MutT (NUDIX family)|uniref:NUDIX hydrolase n=1 Tax=Longimicrobium sp. TaxID=2029185 RepID=UPI002EDA70D1